MTLPFAHGYMYRSAGGYYLIADSGRPEYHVLGPDGSHHLVRWNADPQPFAETDFSDWKDIQRSRTSEERLHELEMAWESIELPSHKPFFDNIVLTSDGAVWVLHGPEDHDLRWTRFDREGRYSGEVQFPARFRLTDAGEDWALGVLSDELDVEFLQLYSLPPR